METGEQARSNPLRDASSVERLGARLNSWKEIACYLGRSEKTLRRWEERENLPVYRLRHEKRGSIYAYTAEIDRWREARTATIDSDATVNGNGLRSIEIPEPAVTADGLLQSRSPLTDKPFSSAVPDDPSVDDWVKETLPDGNAFPWAFHFPILRLAAVGLLLMAAGITSYVWHRARTQSGPGAGERIRSLAVLPLENLSGDAGQEYFADGMTAELITELAKIGSLRVTSRTSAMRYKRSRIPLNQIARELNVDALLEGEVLRSEHRIRINAQLIQAATDRHLWAETYERDLRDAVELQGEVAESIAYAIRTKVTPKEHARLTRNGWVDPEAYDAYLKGRFFWNKRTGPALNTSIDYFRRAINKDPGYALAYAALADSYLVLAGFGFVPPAQMYSEAKAAANKALEFDDAAADAHTVLGDTTYEMDRDWRAAEREFKRAIELNPGYATAHQRYSLFLSRMGRSEESQAEIRRAQALDPLSLIISGGVGWRLLWGHRYDEAVEQLHNALELDPHFGRAHMYLGWAYEAKANFEGAIDELGKANLSAGGPEVLASLAHAHALGGHSRKAERILKDLEQQSRVSYVPPYYIAVVYAGLGKKQQAFEWLSKSCKDQDIELVSLKADLRLDDLRSDPRFHGLLNCAGLAN
jgi:TolB-like protein/Flp pilus assembly protein TadD